jgi:hypothetical protein
MEFPAIGFVLLSAQAGAWCSVHNQEKGSDRSFKRFSGRYGGDGGECLDGVGAGECEFARRHGVGLSQS